MQDVPSIIAITKKFLVENFDPENLDVNFSDEKLKIFLKELEEFYSIDEICVSKSDIRQAIHEYFSGLGDVFVFFRRLEKVVVRVIPFKPEKIDASYINALDNIIRVNKESISNSEDNKNLVVVDEYLYNIIFEVLNHYPHVNKRKMIIKEALKKALELSDKDVIVFFNNKIVIKLYIDVNQNIASERRFNGLPVEELKIIKDNLFPKDDTFQFIKKIIDNLLKSELDFTTIDNEFFEKNYIKIIQNAIIKNLRLRAVDYENFILEGFCNYLLREHFYIIHKIMAEYLVKLVVEKNIEAMNFIKYYSGSTIIVDGIKYTQPSIADMNDNKWNVVTIQSLSTQRLKELALLFERREDVINKLKEDITLQEDLFMGLDIQIRELATQYEYQKSEIAIFSADLKKKKLMFDSLKKEAKHGAENSILASKIDSIMAQINEISAKENELNDSNKKLELKLDELRKKQQIARDTSDGLRKVLDKELSLFDSLKKQQKGLLTQYSDMIDAVAKALTKKKIKVQG